MITSARIRATISSRQASIDHLSVALAIQVLATENAPLQLSLFDDRDLAEISARPVPGERLIVCRTATLRVPRKAARSARICWWRPNGS